MANEVLSPRYMQSIEWMGTKKFPHIQTLRCIQKTAMPCQQTGHGQKKNRILSADRLQVIESSNTVAVCAVRGRDVVAVIQFGITGPVSLIYSMELLRTVHQ